MKIFRKKIFFLSFSASEETLKLSSIEKLERGENGRKRGEVFFKQFVIRYGQLYTIYEESGIFVCCKWKIIVFSLSLS